MSKERDAIIYNLENDRIQVLENGTIIGVWGKPLKPNINKISGHCHIGVTLPDKQRTKINIHRLVYWYFTRDEKMWNNHYHVHHKDGNPQNNSIFNLELISRYEHRSNHTRGVNNPAAKLTVVQVNIIRKMYKTKEYTYKELGKMFGIHKDHIGNIINHRCWV